jgi:hypothetical protein
MLHTVSVDLIQPCCEANGRHVQTRPQSSTTAARVPRTTARKQGLSTFLASSSLCRRAAARGTDSWLLADHPRKQRQTVQGSMLMQALPAWTGGYDYPKRGDLSDWQRG